MPSKETVTGSYLCGSCVKQRHPIGVVPVYLWGKESPKGSYLCTSCAKQRDPKGVCTCVLLVRSKETPKGSYLCTSCAKHRDPKGVVPVRSYLCTSCVKQTVKQDWWLQWCESGGCKWVSYRPEAAPASLLFASCWQHFWGPASYLLGLCTISDSLAFTRYMPM